MYIFSAPLPESCRRKLWNAGERLSLSSVSLWQIFFEASTEATTVSRRLQFKVENIYLIEKNMENYFKTGFTQISLALAAQNLMEGMGGGGDGGGGGGTASLPIAYT